jgi:hypothetical protein
MAPEQVAGRHELVGFGSDIYGLGAILYEILTGLPPFGDSGVTEVLRRVAVEDPTPPRCACPDVPAALEAICLKALAKRPQDRYSTASDMAQDVRRWLADEPVSAYREPAWEKLGRWLRRHRSAVVIAAVMLAALAAGLLAVELAADREQTRTRAALTLAREVVDRFHESTLTDPAWSRPGNEALRLDIVRATNAWYARLARLVPGDHGLRVRLRESSRNLSGLGPSAGDVEDQSGARAAPSRFSKP